LKGDSVPDGLRVPSGKMITFVPARTRSAARCKLFTERSRLLRSMITWPPIASTQPKNGIQVSSRLATKRHSTGRVRIRAPMSITLWWLVMIT
jgi:hypothetical protein